MEFYVLRKSMSDFLRQRDSKVRIEKGTNSRAYIGVLLELDDVLYLAPLGSPKPKHKLLNDRVDFIKVSHTEDLGVVNLNNMVPVKRSGIIRLDFSKVSDVKYRGLLMKQYNLLKSREKELQSKARYLRELSFKVNPTEHEKRIINRCVNFAKLEMLVKYY